MNEHAPLSDASDLRLPPGVLVAAALVAIIVGGIGVTMWPQAFWAGYVVAAVYWLGTSVGCLGIVLIYRTTGGRWGQAGARALHAGIAALPVGLIAVFVIGLGVRYVYHWGGDAEHSPLNPHQRVYFSTVPLLLRMAFYSLVWIGLAVWLRRSIVRESRDPSAYISSRAGAIGLMLVFLTASFFVIDAFLSITPGWMSSLFPLIQLMSFSVTGMAIALIFRNRSLNDPTEQQRAMTHDLANLLQAFNLLWTYLAFSQYLLIWEGDIAHEVDWYLQRRTPLGAWASTCLFLFHFALPFLLLLSRDLKRNPRAASRVAGLLAFMCLVDYAWIVLPSLPESGPLNLLFLVTNWVGLGAIWCLAFEWAYAQLPEIPVRESEGHGAEHVSTVRGHDPTYDLEGGSSNV